MTISYWISDNWIEIFGAVTGIIYVFLEVRQNLWLWPVGIVTSAVYIWVFFTHKIYADMSLQGYYLVISCLGWYWWARGREQGAEGRGQGAESGELRAKSTGKEKLAVTRLKMRTGIVLTMVFSGLFSLVWFVLSEWTDSPVPLWDSFITSLSVIATWMLARKIYEHWYLWIIVNIVSALLFIMRGLYPTVALYAIYCAMSFIGLRVWRRTIGL
ncbi:MAG: nicotinamide riboside transporter PnuC [Bacteroidales bacterium]|nr:nicotinamide riboside transporter PnuC [Bacteroidales bacterium]